MKMTFHREGKLYKKCKGKLKCSKVFQDIFRTGWAICPFSSWQIYEVPRKATWKHLSLITHDVFRPLLGPKSFLFLFFFFFFLFVAFHWAFNYAQAPATSEWPEINLAKSWGINRSRPKKNKIIKQRKHEKNICWTNVNYATTTYQKKEENMGKSQKSFPT